MNPEKGFGMLRHAQHERRMLDHFKSVCSLGELRLRDSRRVDDDFFGNQAVACCYLFPSFGFSTSLMPSPKRLTQSTSNDSAMPGKSASQTDAPMRS